MNANYNVSGPCFGDLTSSESFLTADHENFPTGDTNMSPRSDTSFIVEAPPLSRNADTTTADGVPNIDLSIMSSLSDTRIAPSVPSSGEPLSMIAAECKDSAYAVDQGIVLSDTYPPLGLSEKADPLPLQAYDAFQNKKTEKTDDEFHINSHVPSQTSQSNVSTHICLDTAISHFDLEPRISPSSDPLSFSNQTLPQYIEEKALWSECATLLDNSSTPSVDTRLVLESPETPLTKNSQDGSRSIMLPEPPGAFNPFRNYYPLSPSTSMPSSSPAKLFSSSPLPSSQSSAISQISHSDKIIIDQQIDGDSMASPKMHDSFALRVSSSPTSDLGATTMSPQEISNVSMSPPRLEGMPPKPTFILPLPPVLHHDFDLTTNLESNILGESKADVLTNGQSDTPMKCPSPPASGLVNHTLLRAISNKRTRSHKESVIIFSICTSEQEAVFSEQSSQSRTSGKKEKEDEDGESPALKRSKEDTPPPPAPRRPTVASQRIQHKKLSTPFRSPLMKKTTGAPSGVDRLAVDFHIHPGLNSKLPTDPSRSNFCPNDLPATTPFTPTETHLRSVRTKRAAKQFKSPLSADSSSAVVSSVRLTPTIQTLERKVQVLKRAIKVKRDSDEKTLERLVKKWTEAGREVAYEVWELVKDRGGEDSSGDKSGGWGRDEWSGKWREGFQDSSWGWGGKDENRMGDETERHWGWAASDDEKVHSEDPVKRGEEEEDKKKDTLGTMLMQIGIDPQTLGWDEEEGVFLGE